MHPAPRWTPNVTVSTIVEQDGRFLIVEEQTRLGLRLNQPSGHLEAGESLVEAAIRETREETRWAIDPVALLGVYRWRASESGTTFLRVAFIGHALVEHRNDALDEVIHAVHWLDSRALKARHAAHRSPLVQRCVDDFLAGRRYPLDLLTDFPDLAHG